MKIYRIMIYFGFYEIPQNLKKIKEYWFFHHNFTSNNVMQLLNYLCQLPKYIFASYMDVRTSIALYIFWLSSYKM